MAFDAHQFARGVVLVDHRLKPRDVAAHTAANCPRSRRTKRAGPARKPYTSSNPPAIESKDWFCLWRDHGRIRAAVFGLGYYRNDGRSVAARASLVNKPQRRDHPAVIRRP